MDYPGLGGSLWYHAELWCEDGINAADGYELINTWAGDECCLVGPGCDDPETDPYAQCPQP